jgi:hypothetical protein
VAYVGITRARQLLGLAPATSPRLLVKAML